MKGEFRSRHRAGFCGRRGGSQASCLTYPPLREPLPSELNALTMGNALGRSKISVMWPHGPRRIGNGGARHLKCVRTKLEGFNPVSAPPVVVAMPYAANR